MISRDYGFFTQKNIINRKVDALGISLIGYNTDSTPTTDAPRSSVTVTAKSAFDDATRKIKYRFSSGSCLSGINFDISR